MNDKADGPFDALRREMIERQEKYEKEVLNSRPFQDGLRYLEGIGSDFFRAQTYVRLQGSRYAAADDFLTFRFAPFLAESVLAITQNAKEGLQNAARRELRFMLEAAVKLSCRDHHTAAKTFEERLEGLDDRSKRFDAYVHELHYFDEFEKPGEVNASILSLYAELSLYVHAAVPQFQNAMARDDRREAPGMESVATLNRFNKLAFQVYDHVLVRIFHAIGLSMAGDIFTGILDDDVKWRFHKGKFVGRLSRCFDYKHERQGHRSKT
jgi:hypothetical protein